MKRWALILVCVAMNLEVTVALAAPLIVEEGRPGAEIVIAEDAPRMTQLGADELRHYVRKISGAKLPVVHEPTGKQEVRIFIGRSEYTDELGITDDGLNHGAFRMVSGPDWLVLLGHDADFEPIEPWAHNHGDRKRAQRKWEELTGAEWRNPMGSVHRGYHRESGLWAKDKGGSLQAVYAFLRDLGVRWYMPGKLGEVVPEKASILLPRVNKTVKPDIFYRNLRLGNIPHFPWDDFVWALRLGLNNDGLAGSHGMRTIQANPRMQKSHPEYFAYYGGRRDTITRGSGHACFSSEGLFRETVSFARHVFDHYGKRAVSIFPQDGYKHCGCRLCADKTPSEAVWGFVNRVAKELYKTHPDHLILGGAYTSYQEPPDTIDKFSPNVVVRISWVRPGLDSPESWNDYWALVETWREKLAPRRLMRNFNVHWSASPDFPIIFPRSITREMGAINDIAIGEASSVPRSKEQRWLRPGLSHLNMYVIARYCWDAEQDLDEMLDEYYTLFYGPAANVMHAAFAFAEANYPRKLHPSASLVPLEDRIEFNEQIQAARKIAGDSVYGERIQLILDELTPVEELQQALREREEGGDPREDAPVVLAADATDDREAPTYELRDIDTGNTPEVETTFQVTWEGDAIVFDVVCEEPEMETIPVTDNVWGGDSVAVLLETPFHSYYHVEVNPEGKIYDADWGISKRNRAKWRSTAEVDTERGDDYWRLVIRIPVVPPREGQSDPLHFVVGKKPTEDNPWFFNIGRSRGVLDERRVCAFSPTQGPYHKPGKFARLQVAE